MPQNNIDILIKNTYLLKKMLIIIWAFTESIIFAAEGVNIARGIKTWHTDMKWANDVGNMEPEDLLEAQLTQTFSLLKKKNKEKENSICGIQ